MCGRSWCKVGLVFGVVFGVSAGGVSAEPIPDGDRPTQPGIHHLAFDWSNEGETERMTYGLFIPENYEKATRDGGKLPLIVYLCGAGMRGHEMSDFNNNGPFAEMRRNKHLAPEMDGLIVQPQLHADARWENPTMGGYVADVARRVIERYPVDPERVYLAGMSMGGEGVWHAALAAPELYALVLSMGGRQHPDPAKVAAAMEGATAWIIVGERDGEFVAGSRVMRDAFEAAGVDLVYKEMVGYGHNIWRMFWNKAELYDAMLAHRRGKAQADPPDASTLTDIAELPPPNPKYAAFAEKLQKRFEAFRPWWQIETCRRHRKVGLREEWGGKEQVFATLPFNRHMACRLMTTAEVPEGKRTKLALTVAAGRKPWLLEVDADNKRLLRTKVKPGDDQTPKWRTVEVDLSAYAGEKVLLEVLHLGFRRRNSIGYWAGIEVVSE